MIMKAITNFVPGEWIIDHISQNVVSSLLVKEVIEYSVYGPEYITIVYVFKKKDGTWSKPIKKAYNRRIEKVCCDPNEFDKALNDKKYGSQTNWRGETLSVGDMVMTADNDECLICELEYFDVECNLEDPLYAWLNVMAVINPEGMMEDPSSGYWYETRFAINTIMKIPSEEETLLRISMSNLKNN